MSGISMVACPAGEAAVSVVASAAVSVLRSMRIEGSATDGGHTPLVPFQGGRKVRGIELFAGAGGLGIGAARAGFEPVLVVERDRWCCDTLRENHLRRRSPIKRWPEPFEGDIRAMDFAPFEGVDIVTGGPPCQPFSLGGRHRSFARCYAHAQRGPLAPFEDIAVASRAACGPCWRALTAVVVWTSRAGDPLG